MTQALTAQIFKAEFEPVKSKTYCNAGAGAMVLFIDKENSFPRIFVSSVKFYMN